MTPPFSHLRFGGTSVVVDHRSDDLLPVIVYWGADLGDVPASALESIATASLPQRVSGGLDRTARASVLPLESDGWQFTPGLVGAAADGTRVSPKFTPTTITGEGSALTLEARDPESQLDLSIDLLVDHAGLFHQRARVTNRAATVWVVSAMALTFPLPATAAEVLDTTGRHLKERTPQRSPLVVGEHVRYSRKGRPGADATLLLAAGEPSFGFRRGIVHALSVAWSGNHVVTAARTPMAQATLTGGELLLPGEGALRTDETYESPWVIGSWGDGLDAVAARFHSWLRARPQHPISPRPVTLNTWEAVYFEHDLDHLTALADAAAAIGVERFVLDDGWFRGRRDDSAGLGDWVVDETVWPNGLWPLVHHVQGAGMQFGLWVEPEMVNLDSDLARAHPDWILGPQHRDPLTGRGQQVLNLANADAYEFVLALIDDLLDEYPIDYLKWDHNRDLIEAIDRRSGRYAVHDTTAALYRLLDELRKRHPGLEIESCASGGARVDLGILQRTDRIWASDCIDPLERLDNQAYTNLLVPYEMIGAHVGAPRSHSTHRVLDLDLQAAVAFFGHLGVEWDLAAASAVDIARLAEWIAVWKRHRDLLHTGTAVRSDTAPDTIDVRGVVSPDLSRAVYSVVQRAATVELPPGMITLPGLDPDALYRVEVIPPTSVGEPGQSPLAWAAGDAPVLPGRVLGRSGLQAPVQYPQQAVLVAASRVPA